MQQVIALSVPMAKKDFIAFINHLKICEFKYPVRRLVQTHNIPPKQRVYQELNVELVLQWLWNRHDITWAFKLPLPCHSPSGS
jgi:hypothetical protein